MRCLVTIMLFVAAGATQGLAQDGLTPIELLGKRLFFDSNLSTPPGQSCAVCHGPRVGFTGPDALINAAGAVYEGAVHNRFGDRKPPTVAYAASPMLHYDEEEGWIGGSFWDGRATGWRLGDPLAEQAMGPFLNPLEQNMPFDKQVIRRVARSDYAPLFEAVWGAGSLDTTRDVAATYERIGHSIAAYERSAAEVSAFTSKFDSYWRISLAVGNDPEAVGLGEGEKDVLDPFNILTDQEFAGLIEFGEYCARCHDSTRPGDRDTPPLFTDFSYHNIGVPKNPENPFYTVARRWNPDGENFVDPGLGGFLRSAGFEPEVYEIEVGKFKVPTVRNVDKRPDPGFVKAYMHNGALKSLEDVVHFYNTRDVPSANWPPPEVSVNLNDELFEGHPIGDFQLDAEAEAAIVAFLKTLTDGYGP